MIPIKKYTKGKLVSNFSEVLIHAKQGGYFYDGKRLVHGSWIVNMGLASLERRVAKSLYIADRNPKAPFVFDVIGRDFPEEMEYLATCSELQQVLQVQGATLTELFNNCKKEVRGYLGLDYALLNNCDPTIEIRYRA